MIKIEEKDVIEAAIKKHPLSMADAAKELNLPFGTFKYRAKKFGLYNPNQQHKGRTFVDGRKGSTPLNEILEGKHPKYRTARLKERMLQEGLLENKCDSCGLENSWNGKSIVMELDHINGVNNDHRKSNLRLLCPNCHSLTKTYKGANNGNGRYYRRKRYAEGKSY